MRFSCSSTSLSITLKTFLKHTCQCQIASLSLYVNKEMFSISFFQEQLKKKNKHNSDLLSCCYSYSYKNYEEIFNNTSYIQEKKQNNMLPFNPILSQSRAMQSLKNFQRGL